MTDIKTRADIHLLVSTFYSSVRADALLGPIFNGVIDDWEEHFEILTNFWESNLFFKSTYSGNPMQKHIQVDKRFDEGIDAMHFGVWLNLWYATIDALFEGEIAQLAKNRARNMSTFIYLKIFEARKKE